MNISELLDDALGKEPGAVSVSAGGIRAEAQVEKVSELAVVLNGLKLTGQPAPLEDRVARALEVRIAGDRLSAFELAPELGGAILRSRPEDIHRGFWELRLSKDQAKLERYSLSKGGIRYRARPTLTREQLCEIVTELEDVMKVTLKND